MDKIHIDSYSKAPRQFLNIKQSFGNQQYALKNKVSRTTPISKTTDQRFSYLSRLRRTNKLVVPWLSLYPTRRKIYNMYFSGRRERARRYGFLRLNFLKKEYLCRHPESGMFKRNKKNYRRKFKLSTRKYKELIKSRVLKRKLLLATDSWPSKFFTSLGFKRSKQTFFRKSLRWFLFQKGTNFLRFQKNKLYYKGTIYSFLAVIFYYFIKILHSSQKFKSEPNYRLLLRVLKFQTRKFFRLRRRKLTAYFFFKNKNFIYANKILWLARTSSCTRLFISFREFRSTGDYFGTKRRKRHIYTKLFWTNYLLNETWSKKIVIYRSSGRPLVKAAGPLKLTGSWRSHFILRNGEPWLQPQGKLKKLWRQTGRYFCRKRFNSRAKPRWNTYKSRKIRQHTHLIMLRKTKNHTKFTTLKLLHATTWRLKNNLFFYFWKVLYNRFGVFNPQHLSRTKLGIENILAVLSPNLFAHKSWDNRSAKRCFLLNFYIGASKKPHYKKVRKISGYLRKGVWFYNYRAFARTLVLSLSNKKKRFIRRLYAKRVGGDWFLRVPRKKFFYRRRNLPQYLMISKTTTDDNKNCRLTYRFKYGRRRRVRYKLNRTRLLRSAAIVHPRVKKLVHFRNSIFTNIQRAIHSTRCVFRIFVKFISRVFYRLTLVVFKRGRKRRHRGKWKSVYYDRQRSLMLSNTHLKISKKRCLVFFKQKNLKLAKTVLVYKNNKNNKFLSTNFKNKVVRAWFKKPKRPFMLNTLRNSNAFFKLKLINHFKYTKQKRLKLHRGFGRFFTNWAASNRFFFENKIFKRLKFTLLGTSVTNNIKKIRSTLSHTTVFVGLVPRKLLYSGSPTQTSTFFSLPYRYGNHYANLSVKKFKKLLTRDFTWYHWRSFPWRKSAVSFANKQFYKRVVRYRWKWFHNRYTSRENSELKTKWSKKKFYFLIRKLVPASGWYRWKLSFIAPRLSHLFGFRRTIFSTSPWLEVLAFTNKLYLLRTFFDYYRAKSLSLTKKYKQYRATEIMFNTRPHKIRYEIMSSIILKRLNFFYFSRRHKYFFKKIKLHCIRNKYMFSERQSFLYYYFISSVPSMAYQLSFAPTISWSINYVLSGFIFHKRTPFDIKKDFR